MEGQSSEELNVSQICSDSAVVSGSTESSRSSVDGLGVQMWGVVQVFLWFWCPLLQWHLWCDVPCHLHRRRDCHPARQVALFSQGTHLGMRSWLWPSALSLPLFLNIKAGFLQPHNSLKHFILKRGVGATGGGWGFLEKIICWEYCPLMTGNQKCYVNLWIWLAFPGILELLLISWVPVDVPFHGAERSVESAKCDVSPCKLQKFANLVGV